MKLNLKQYTVPAGYADIYDHNFRQIDHIQQDPLLNELVLRLSGISGIDYEIVLLDLKRYLMNVLEYNPLVLNATTTRSDQAGKAVLSQLRQLFTFPGMRRDKYVDVLLDDFSDGVLDHLYGRELVAGLRDRHKIGILNFAVPLPISLKDLLLSAPAILRCLLYNRRIVKTAGVNLQRYILNFFRQYLTGLVIRKTYGPKLIVSGNDNGFPVLIGKAAGADILLIQNAKKTLFSDATFKYADHLISMGDMEYSGVLKATGCLFRRTYPYGSIRFYHYLSANRTTAQDLLYDIVWISDLEYNEINEGIFGRYYTRKSEIEAIQLLNEYASTSPFKIAFKCRLENEKDVLKELGLLSEKITYIGKREQNTYEVVLRSRLVLSPISSVVFEAMGMGKPGGYVNLSRNKYVNYDVRDLDMEFTEASKETFSAFVERLLRRSTDYSRHTRQNPDYVKDVLAVISKAVKGS